MIDSHVIAGYLAMLIATWSLISGRLFSKKMKNNMKIIYWLKKRMLIRHLNLRRAVINAIAAMHEPASTAKTHALNLLHSALIMDDEADREIAQELDTNEMLKRYKKSVYGGYSADRDVDPKNATAPPTGTAVRNG